MTNCVTDALIVVLAMPVIRVLAWLDNRALRGEAW
jgi:hypothetical protein